MSERYWTTKDGRLGVERWRGRVKGRTRVRLLFDGYEQYHDLASITVSITPSMTGDRGE